MSDILVIGGNGFIGSHLVDALVANGHAVAVMDLFSDQPTHWQAAGVEMIDGDFLNEADVRRAVRGRDVVAHMLSLTDPARSEEDPTLDVRTNVMSSIALFRACVDAGVGHVLFPSSGGSVYGPQEQHVFSETSPTLPVSPYAIGKLTLENYLAYFRRKHGLRSTTVRLSNPYGMRQNPHKRQGIIPLFLQRVARGLPLTVMGDGTMVRDYVYVNDVARLMAQMLTTGTRHDLYNLGSGTGTSVNEVIATIAEVTGIVPEVEHVPTPSTYVDHVTLDISRLVEELGDPGFTSLREGVAATWAEVRERAGRPA